MWQILSFVFVLGWAVWVARTLVGETDVPAWVVYPALTVMVSMNAFSLAGWLRCSVIVGPDGLTATDTRMRTVTLPWKDIVAIRFVPIHHLGWARVPHIGPPGNYGTVFVWTASGEYKLDSLTSPIWLHPPDWLDDLELVSTSTSTSSLGNPAVVSGRRIRGALMPKFNKAVSPYGISSHAWSHAIQLRRVGHKYGRCWRISLSRPGTVAANLAIVAFVLNAF